MQFSNFKIPRPEATKPDIKTTSSASAPEALASHPRLATLKAIGITVPVAVTFSLFDIVENCFVDVTLGLFFLFGTLLACPLVYFAYHQQRLAGDSHHVSLSKALLLGALTIVPVFVTPIVAGPMGLAGYVAKKLEKHQ